MATLYLDLEGGNDGNAGTSFANRKKTFAGVSAIAAAGDTVRVMGSPAAASLGVNGTWATGDYKMTLASAVNADIDTGESAWTASANVTCTTSTTRKEGATSSSIAVAAGFTTGLAAYIPMGATNFSAYQQISFWIQQTTGTLAANISIKLCSDAAGATPVDTLTLPAALGALNAWHPIVINKGSALGASIQSVALYVDSDQAAQTFLIDNIVACKASGGTGELTHQHLIGKSNSIGAGGTDAETWYPIRSIRSTTVAFDLRYNAQPSDVSLGRYFGTAETVAAYSIKKMFYPNTATTADNTWITSGTSGSRIAISGGWNRTDMTTQTLYTIIGMGYYTTTVSGLLVTGSYLDISNIGFSGMNGNALSIVGTSNTVTSMHISGCNGSLGVLSTNSTYTSPSVVCCAGSITIGGYTNVVTGMRLENEQQSLTVSGGNCTVSLLSGAMGTPLAANIGATLTVGSGATLSIIGASSIGAREGDTGVSLDKALEMLAAFIAGKVSVSSAGGVSTYTYKKRDGTTTSFTSLCSETNGTRVTTGAIS